MTPATVPGEVCARCGTFVPAESAHLVLSKSYCADCAARPDVNYLKAFRDKYWGKRDGWAWSLGVYGVAVFGLGCAQIVVLVSGRPAMNNSGLVLAMTFLGAIASFTFW